MTPKQRLLSAIKGEPIDHVPYSPFLAYYFENLDAETQAKGQLDYFEKMGADPLLRGFYAAWSGRSKNCTVEQKNNGNNSVIIRHTSKGELISEYKYVESSNTNFLVKHPVETVDDLMKLKEYYEDLEIDPQIDAFNNIWSDIGDRALILSIVGSDCKSCFQSLLEHWIGTENLIYMCYDYPDEIEEVIEVMKKKARKTIEYTAMSKAEACISWEDSSTTNLNPALYEKFVQPELTDWVNIMRESGKMYIQHACGHIKDLLTPMAKQGVAAVESLSPSPTGNVSVEEAINILPKEVGIIGGIEPTFMLNSSIKELDEYVRRVIDLNKGRKFVLANSDSCPPGVAYEKFVHIAKLVKELRY